MPLSAWHFDIDRYLNPILPRNPVHRLPYPIAHFLGHRDAGRPPKPPVGNLVSVFWAFIGVFSAILLIEAVNHQVQEFKLNDAPIIVASFGAAAVLEFYSIDAPLAQPRNAIFGQIISALVGVIVAKIFGGPDTLLLSTMDDPSLSSRSLVYRWAGGALACACATACMALTGCVHPPAGATALLAVVDDRTLNLGWWYVPIMMLGCALMLCVALLVNNIQRRFPIYWHSPRETGTLWKRSSNDAPPAAANSSAGGPDASNADLDSARDIEAKSTDTEPEDPRIVISKGTVELPETLQLLPEERLLLEAISKRL